MTALRLSVSYLIQDEEITNGITRLASFIEMGKSVQ